MMEDTRILGSYVHIGAMERAASLLSSLRRDWSALLGVFIIVAVVAAATLAPVLAPMDPYEQSLSRTLKPPLWSDGEHIFLLGTDHLGRDFLSRLIYGSRVSLIVGAFAVLLSGGAPPAPGN